MRRFIGLPGLDRIMAHAVTDAYLEQLQEEIDGMTLCHINISD